MPNAPSDRLVADAKQAAALRAVALVEPGMGLGLGSGSTAELFVRALGDRAGREALGLACVATSEGTARLAQAQGLALGPLEGLLDLTVDGADEIDPHRNLIKGGGGALLREKMVAAASARLVIVADAGKRVDRLGAFPLPVEVVRFGWQATRAAIASVLERADVGGRNLRLRETEGAPAVTDEGHYLLDLDLGHIADPGALAAALSAIPGVVEHGLFLGMANAVVIGHGDGTTEMLGAAAAPADPGCGPAAETTGDIAEAMRNQDA